MIHRRLKDLVQTSNKEINETSKKRRTELINTQERNVECNRKVEFLKKLTSASVIREMYSKSCQKTTQLIGKG